MDDEALEQETEEEVVEVVDGVMVLAQARAIEPPPAREGAGLVQVAAVAATGFVAGAATAAVLGRRFARRAGTPVPSPFEGRRHESYRVVASRRYVVDVHLVTRP